MPRGRRRKNRGPNNVQSKLTARLMQISLKMDDHIYYNKPMSKAAAEEFLEEVSRMKQKCPRNDVRALQVIDKVTLFMKNIIAEDREQEINEPTFSIPAYTEFAQTHSPVYSMPDEDRLDDVTLCSSPDVPMIEITEVSDANREEQNAIERVNLAISYMAIQDEIVTQAEVLSDDDCSQSILDHFQSVDFGPKDDTIAETGITVLSNEIPTPQVTNELINKFPVNGTLASSSTHAQEIINTTNTENLNFEIACNQENTISNLVTDSPQVSVPEVKNRVVQRKNKDSKKYIRKRKPKSTDIKSDKATESNKKTKVHKEKKSKVIPVDTEPLDPNVNNTVGMIYNKNVENDLSWVENLRFVREIEPEENDPRLCNLEDNFWDNFSLPNQWNDCDFEY